MKTVSIEQANKSLRKANNEGSLVVIHFDGEKRSYDAGEAKLFHSAMEPGVYSIRIEKRVGEDSETQEMIVSIEVPPVEKPAPVVHATPPAPISETTLKDPTLLVIELRKQDQASMAQERLFHQSQMESLRREHEADIARIRAEHQTELARLKGDHDFQLKLVENNQGKLEKDRDELAKIIERRLRSETRFGKNQTDMAWLDKIMENPIAMMFLAKTLKIDVAGLLPMLMGNAGTAGMDLTKIDGPDFQAALKLAQEALGKQV